MKLALVLASTVALWAQVPPRQNVERVFSFTQPAAPGFSDGITAIRTIADIDKATIDDDAHSLTVSAPADRMPLAEWLFHEMDQATGPVKTAVTHAYPLQVETPQGPEVAKVFYLAHAETPQALTDAVTGVRTVADVPRLFPLTSLRAIAARGSAERMAAAEWLIHEVDRAADEVQAPAVHGYGIPMPWLNPKTTSVMKVFFLAHGEAPRAISDMITILRTVASAERVFPFNANHAILVSAAPDRVAAAEWLFHELDQPPAGSLSVSTYKPQSDFSGRGDVVVLKVFHLSPAVSDKALIELLTSIRTTAGIQRTFPATAPRSIALCAITAAAAEAERLVRQRDQSAAQ